MSVKAVIMDVRGVGEVRAKQLKDLGINSVEALAAAKEATLISIRGVSPRIAAELTAAAAALLHTPLPKQLPVTKPKVKKDKNAGAAKSKKKDRNSDKKTTKKAAIAVADKLSKKAKKNPKKKPSKRPEKKPRKTKLKENQSKPIQV
ncbi:Helix-hairpin-helix domain-containing protein [Arsukibacterium tuosuense]|uniref:Helix-hairpin-helix domain-containing protein n=1 Tax=Arsukibacterium tuosuense TaxID=1323745 RepID=A0A285I268_9GAMM|nr:helix-hairpin-helix domain-containing protein [Arsukibacterium tuosuense]SNY41983.1 Helix-hairpin-helix domain-containing protein [Arsukibacterium tuosuense]